MPVKDQAAYMREYRAKRKAARPLKPVERMRGATMQQLIAENARLTEEVARLKRELAARPEPVKSDRLNAWAAEPTFGQSRPAPKPGKHG